MEEQKIAISEDMLGQFAGLEEDFSEMPIPLNLSEVVTEDLEGLIPYDVAKFKKGVDDYSYIAGAFVALRNSGMSEANAISWLVGQEEMKAVKLQLASQEAIAKTQAEGFAKGEL